MSSSEKSPDDNLFLHRIVEATVRVGLLIVLVGWCFFIVRPFIVPIVWGVIIALAAYPVYSRLEHLVGGLHWLAASLFIVIALLVLIVPAGMLSGTVIDNAQLVAQDLGDGALAIPPPWKGIESLPVVGEPLRNFWELASVNLDAALHQIKPQLKAVGLWLLASAAGAGMALLQFVVAIVIAAVFMARAEGGARVAQAIASRLSAEKGEEFLELAGQTVRGVARGILGVALIQSILAGLGFLAAGVPAAGLWALICLILGVIQIGITPVLIPVIVYLFVTADTVTAVAFLIWSIPVGLLDSILKPILLGRGSKVPMVIIFLGAIGGFLASGIIGLFLGAVILALGYELFLAWLDEGSAAVANTAVQEQQDPGTDRFR